MGQIEVLIDFGVPYVRLEDYRAMQARLEPAVARAEAAEAELAGLRERHENAMARLKALIEDVPLLFQRVVKAEARMFELEAAARWRPVSEKPVDDKPVLALMKSGEYKVARYVVIGDINGVPLHLWCGTGGASKHVAYWRPITEEAPAE